MAITPEQMTDILAKSATVRTTKVAYDAAVSANNLAIADAQSAETAFLASVDNGDPAETIEDRFETYVTRAVIKKQTDDDLLIAAAPYNTAQSELATAKQAVVDSQLD